jgi:DNA polymerase-3 subunit delta'
MWQTIGQETALAALQRVLAGGSPAHAWAFVGPEGVGKRTAALEFAAALNCAETDRPCGQCRSCRDILAGQHPDVEVVEPGGLCDEPEHRDHAESRDLRICQIRRLERVLSLSPYAARRRVAIIDAADTLRAEAANAFLKTLEEPPADTVIVLLIERDERLPETVLSRCRRVSFRLLQRETIAAALQAHGAPDSDVETIAGAAGGRLGWALRALADPSLLDERASMLDNTLRLAHAGAVERFAWAAAATERSNSARERYLRELSVWESWWRDLLMAGNGAVEGLVNRDRESLLVEEGRLYRSGDVVAFLRALLQTREYLQENVDPQLALENLTLDLPRPLRGGPVR